MFTPDRELDACLVKYSIALINPFDENAIGACVPSFPSFPSMKIRSFARFTTHVGSTGVGWAIAKGDCANNVSTVHYTDTGYLGTESTAITTGGGTGLFDAVTNNSYSTTEFGKDLLQQRLVSLGLRIRYVGTELNRSGRVSMVEHPTHDSWNAISVIGVKQFDNATSNDFGRSWHMVTWQPINAIEMQYNDTASSPYDSGAYPLVIAYTGVAGQAVEVEVMLHHELTGRTARAKTTNTADSYFTEKIISKLGSYSSAFLNNAINAAANHPNATKQVVKTLLSSVIPSTRWATTSRMLAYHDEI
jgi:hypothetical protein